MSVRLLGLRTVIHPVTDLAAATAWWTDLLGVGPYFEESFYVGFDVAGYELGLLPDAPMSDGAYTYWGVEDAAAAVEDAVTRGATVVEPATERGEGIVTAMVRTPDGALHGMIYNAHFQAK